MLMKGCFIRIGPFREGLALSAFSFSAVSFQFLLLLGLRFGDVAMHEIEIETRRRG
jgi:hypothetical protein